MLVCAHTLYWHACTYLQKLNLISCCRMAIHKFHIETLKINISCYIYCGVQLHPFQRILVVKPIVDMIHYLTHSHVLKFRCAHARRQLRICVKYLTSSARMQLMILMVTLYHICHRGTLRHWERRSFERRGPGPVHFAATTHDIGRLTDIYIGLTLYKA